MIARHASQLSDLLPSAVVAIQERRRSETMMSKLPPATTAMLHTAATSMILKAPLPCKCPVQSMIADRASCADLDALREVLSSKAGRDELDAVASSMDVATPLGIEGDGLLGAGEGGGTGIPQISSTKRLQSSLSSLATKEELRSLSQQVRATGVQLFCIYDT